MKKPVKRTLKDVETLKEDEEQIKEALGVAVKDDTCSRANFSIAYEVNQNLAKLAVFCDEIAQACEKKAAELIKKSNEMWLAGDLVSQQIFGEKAIKLQATAKEYRESAVENRKQAIAVMKAVNGKKEVEPTL